MSDTPLKPSKPARPARSSAGFDLSRRDFLALSAATGAGLLVNPSLGHAAEGTPPSEPTGQVVAGLSQEPTNFHPLMPHIEVDMGVHLNLYDQLWGVDTQGNFVPKLAAEVPTVENGGLSEDGLEWRIKLRDGVMWHDGEPFTAEDVKFTLELIQNPDFRAGRRAGHELVRDIEVVSPTEITWRMEKPYAPYKSILSWTFIVPRHVLADMDLKAQAFQANPIGTGPFKWEERVSGDHITMKANHDYFGDGPYVETLVWKYVPDLNVLYTQFKAGEVDYIGLQGITANHYNEATTLEDRDVHAVAAPFIEQIALNLGMEQFKERAVREALYFAMDREAVIETVYYGLPRPSESYLPQESWAYNPDLPQQEYDPERAKRILDEAGWTPGSDGVRQKSGVRLAFKNSTTAGNQVREQAQQVLQQNWRQIGVEMTIENHPPAVMWGDMWMMAQYETAMVGLNYMTGPDPDATNYLHSDSIAAQGGAGQNTTQYSNPEVDRLLEEGATTTDRDARIEAYHKVQEIMRHDLPMLYLFQYTQVEGTMDDLMGFKANINMASNAWSIKDWYWADA